MWSVNFEGAGLSLAKFNGCEIRGFEGFTKEQFDNAEFDDDVDVSAITSGGDTPTFD